MATILWTDRIPISRLAQFGLFLAGLIALSAQAEDIQAVKSFDALLEGGNPSGAPILVDGVLYGTALNDGPTNDGAVFKVNPDGAGYQIVAALPGLAGNTPNGDLVYANGVLYGTFSGGGAQYLGGVFSVNISTGVFSAIHNFSGPDGSNPEAGLVLDGNTLYGVAQRGGDKGFGTVFRVEIGGGNFHVLHSFLDADDGAIPISRLTLANGLLYGATSGDAVSDGTVFSLGEDGSGYTVLHRFNQAVDGAAPAGALVVAGGVLYGTTPSGGTGMNGTIFSMKTDGRDFRLLKTFTGGGDGSYPSGGLALEGTTLYGAGAFIDGGWGFLYTLQTDGTGYQSMAVFTGYNGTEPFSDLLLADGVLYGTTLLGGAINNSGGVLFSYAILGPLLSIAPVGGNLVLSWPVGGTYTLETARTPDSNLWSPVLGPVESAGGTNSVTTQLASDAAFFRLHR